MHTETWRTFLALELPPELRNALAVCQTELQQRGVDGKWVRPSGIHLTLKFLGSTPVDQIGAIADAVAPALAGVGPFDLHARGLGVFGRPHNPRVLWIGLAGATDACAHLAAAIETALEPLGFPPEDRGFQPHLTLARFKRRPDRRALESALTDLAACDLGSLPGREIVHYRSHLKSTGAEYEALARFELGGNPS